MTNNERVEAFRMRLEGSSYAEIAQKFGVSRQYIQQCIGLHPHKANFKKTKYKGINNWMDENEMTINSLRKKLYGSGYVKYNLYDKLSGKTKLNINDIIAILNMTGMTFEQAFGEEELSQEE